MYVHVNIYVLVIIVWKWNNCFGNFFWHASLIYQSERVWANIIYKTLEKKCQWNPHSYSYFESLSKLCSLWSKGVRELISLYFIASCNGFFHVLFVGWLVWFMVFNATFNNISVILWRSVLLVEEAGVPGKKQEPVASHWQTVSHNTVSSTLRLSRGSNSR